MECSFLVTLLFFIMEITVLCKVVDNFGDIGVVYRMCRRFLELDSSLSINLIIDDLDSFSKICDDLNSLSEVQTVAGIKVWKWNADTFCHDEFIKNDGEKLSLILECFQCGRPDWMEKILFEEKLNRTVQIIMIDYLTAEDYAEDFHCLQSLTRSAKVQKVNFMPGFTQKTGGLIIEDEWKDLPLLEKDGNILVFTYEKKMKPLTLALEKFLKKENLAGGDEKASCTNKCMDRKILVGAGRGQKPFLDGWEKLSKEKKVFDGAEEKDFNSSAYVSALPFLNQTEWDKMLKDCSVLVIRGEESLSRACLSGIPFLWNAYPQSEEYQLVKVQALLNRMQGHFEKEYFEIVKNAWLDFNSAQRSDEETESSLEKFFCAKDELAPFFADFALSLRKNGDLCTNLMTFIEKNCIINK